MPQKTVLIAFSEIGLRSPQIRRRYIRLLKENLEDAVIMLNRKLANVVVTWDRIFLFVDDADEVAKEVCRVPGVRFSAPAFYSDFQNLDKLVESIAKESLPYIANKRFKVETKRRFKQLPKTSLEISAMIGERVLELCKEKGVITEVDLNNPDVIINVEVDRKYFTFYLNRFDGFGGLPIGSQSELVSLFSGGIDSALSTWLMLNRGCETHPLFINITGTEKALKNALNMFRQIKRLVLYPHLKLIALDASKALQGIVKQVEKKHICIHCKRTMYRLATEIARSLKAKGIVTGESIGQVASQTLDNLQVLSEATDLPIFRPLVGFSKDFIHELAAKVGILEITPEKIECPYVPPHPSTRAKLEQIKREEEKLNLEEIIKSVLSTVKFYE